MARVELNASGSDEAVEAITRLMNIAQRRGFPVRIEDPATLASGAGRIEIEFPDIDERNYAHAAAQSLIDDVPGGDSVFTIV